ncbi:probable pectinesterase/pectinesterase inhibitor 58 [Asparagus officinalis]|uniref:probable pectinesterase/pectinesterase inhibitor 58 n=1 Tax=Asparagus officinalis TaxID=4686 RepID=UPI00098DF75F|nr:probable pectinesterase/pectinesterase inhibitor 58 [Asparagus officinalis]
MRNNKNKISIIAGSLVLSPPWSHASSSSSSTTTSPTTTSPPPLPPAAPPLRKSIQTDLPARRFRDSLPRKSSPKGSGQRHDTKSHQSRLEVPSEYLREELQPLRLLAEAAKDPRTPRLEDCQASFENAIKDYERRLDSFMGYPPRHGHVAWDINTVVTSAVSKLCTTARTAWPTTNKAAKRSKTPQQDAGDRPERDGDIARDREVHRGLQPVGHVRGAGGQQERRSLRGKKRGMCAGGPAASTGEIWTKPPFAVRVAQDGSEQFRTIMEGLGAMPRKNKEYVVMYIKEGVYNEHVEVDRTLNMLVLVGDGPTKTRITGNLNVQMGGKMSTSRTATFTVMADDFNVPKGHRRVRSKHADRRRLLMYVGEPFRV